MAALRTIVKALELSYDYSNLFQTAKILADIRPVFDRQASKMEGAIISYSLRLTFRSLRESESLTIALDEKDVKQLIETCTRALKKADVAKKTMQGCGLPSTYITGEED